VLGEGSHLTTRLNGSAVDVSLWLTVSDRHVRCMQCIEHSALTDATCLAVERQQVVVDPETKTHVWIEQQVGNSTTRYTSVFVDAALGICNLNNSTQWVYDHAFNAVRGAARDVDEQMSDSK